MTQEEAHETLRQLAREVGRLRTLRAEKEALLVAVENRFTARLTELEKRVSDGAGALRGWARGNRGLAKKGKIEFADVGCLRFENSPPRVALERGMAEDAIVNALEVEFADYVREERSVNRAALLAQWAALTDAVRAKLVEIGVRVGQRERIAIEVDGLGEI